MVTSMVMLEGELVVLMKFIETMQFVSRMM